MPRTKKPVSIQKIDKTQLPTITSARAKAALESVFKNDHSLDFPQTANRLGITERELKTVLDRTKLKLRDVRRAILVGKIRRFDAATGYKTTVPELAKKFGVGRTFVKSVKLGGIRTAKATRLIQKKAEQLLPLINFFSGLPTRFIGLDTLTRITRSNPGVFNGAMGQLEKKGLILVHRNANPILLEITLSGKTRLNSHGRDPTKRAETIQQASASQLRLVEKIIKEIRAASIGNSTIRKIEIPERSLEVLRAQLLEKTLNGE